MSIENIHQINEVNINRDLLYSIRNYTQYLIITYKEKESEKEQIYVYNTYAWLSHFAVHL